MTLATREAGYESCISDCVIGQALDGLSVGMVLTNPAGRILWVNRVAERVLGASRKECVGRLLSQVLRDPHLASFWHKARKSDIGVVGEVSVQWPEKLDLKVNAASCVDPRGSDIGRALMFCDVTQEMAVKVELSQAVAQRLLDMAGGAGGSCSPAEGLTPQELRILRAVGGGLGNQEIAAELGVSSSTIRSHLKSVYRKLGLGSRAEAIRYAVRNDLA